MVTNESKRPSWDEYFMNIAEVVASRSRDPDKHVGAVIVKDNVISGVGYNGFPRNTMNKVDEELAFGLEPNTDLDKNDFTVHAEANAIINSTGDLKGATLYCTLFPCHECAKLIVQAGIKRIVFKDPWKPQKRTVQLSKYILSKCEVELVQFNKEV